jgi:hypothetical protein
MKDNQYIGNVKNQRNVTHDINREPFEVKILDAMRELESFKDSMELVLEDDPDSDDAYLGDEEIVIVGMGLIFHLTGEKEPCLTDQEMHEFGKHPDLLEDYLFQDASGWYGPLIKGDLFWLIIVDKITKAYAKAYKEMHLEEVEVR